MGIKPTVQKGEIQEGELRFDCRLRAGAGEEEKSANPKGRKKRKMAVHF